MAKRNVAFVKPPEPEFLKKFKEKSGYKEGPDINTKRQALEAALDQAAEDKEDEQPQIVVLKPGDLSKEEVEGLKVEEKEEEKGGDAVEPARIVFKKPEKRKSEVLNTISSSKKDKDEDCSTGEGDSGRDKKRAKDASEKRKTKNARLLSFQDDDDDD